MTRTRYGESGDRGTVPDPRKIIWFAMTASVLLYGIVAFAVVAPAPGSAPGPPGWVFPVLAMAPAAAAVLLRQRLSPPGGNPSRRAEPAYPGVPSGDFVVWALDEAVAVFGLVDAFLRGTPALFPLYGAAALLLLWLHRPAD